MPHNRMTMTLSFGKRDYWFLQPITVAAMILLGLMAALYLTATRSFDRLEKEYAQTLNTHIFKLRHLDEMLRTAQKRHVMIYNIAMMEDPFEREEAINEHAVIALQYVKARDAFMAFPMNEFEKRNMEELLFYNQQGYWLQLEIIDALQNDRPDKEITALINFHLSPVLEEMYQYMVYMRENQIVSSEEAEKMAKRNLESGHRQMAIIFFIAMILGVVVTVLSYQLQNRHQKQLNWQAEHDALTGLHNRYAFESMLDKSIVDAKAHQHQHVVLYVDLDQFKLINDTVGHHAGDEMLRQIANRLQKLVPENSFLARMGGDEFGILIQQGGEKEASRLAEKILADMKEFQFSWVNNYFHTTASIGIVEINESTPRKESLLSALDLACYSAKEQGRNRYHVFHESDEETNSRRGEMYWATKVRDALQENRLILYRQPIMLCKETSGQEQHYEILVRMQERSGKIITPEYFINAAERYDLCALVDIRVIEKLTNYIVENSENTQEKFSINLSGRSIISEELLDQIIQTLDKTGIDPSRLCFEITETAAIANLTAATHFMGVLSQRGCRFSLDDFGSGLSSFGYLRELPVDFVKIDASFIRNIAKNPTDLAIVAAMNEVSHALGLQTIAEGIEDAQTLETVKKIGIDYAQGYYIAMPAPLIKVAV